jgi:hypothetical protein
MPAEHILVCVLKGQETVFPCNYGKCSSRQRDVAYDALNEKSIRVRNAVLMCEDCAADVVREKGAQQVVGLVGGVMVENLDYLLPRLLSRHGKRKV